MFADSNGKFQVKSPVQSFKAKLSQLFSSDAVDLVFMK